LVCVDHELSIATLASLTDQYLTLTIAMLHYVIACEERHLTESTHELVPISIPSLLLGGGKLDVVLDAFL